MRKLVRTSSLLGLVAFLALGGAAAKTKGPPPPPCTVTSVEATYPMIVESGVPAQLQVTLLNGTSPVVCAKSIDITTTDRKAKRASLLLSRDGGFLYELALVTGPTQSVTVAVGAASTTISGIQVSTNSLSVEAGISTLVMPKPKQLVPIPTNNNVIDDGALNGGISLNGQIYFFASNGKGGKLYSYDPINGVQQRSNTNPTGPDHQWAGGVRVVNGVIYFNAFSNKGCIKIYKYAPGDPMVTNPIANVNKDMCTPIPDQIATQPDLSFGNGQTGSIPFGLGHDTPFPVYFAPIGVGTLVYFVANNGSQYDVYEYNPQRQQTRAITNLPTPVVAPDGLYLLGVNAGQLVFATANGIYQYTPGGPPVTAPTTPGTPPVGIEVATGILLNNINYFDNGGLARWTIGDAAPTMLSAGISEIADLGVINGTVVFSAIDSTQERWIYAYTPGGTATVTTPLVASCSSPCSEPSTPVGLIGDQFYFNGRDSSKGLKFYQTAWPVSSSVSASPAFTVNTAPMSYVVASATLGDAVYFLSFEGFVGYLHSDKFPNYGFERGNGRSGFGNHELYVLPAGSTTAQQVFDTVDVDSDGDDVASGTKYPSALTQVGDRMYFRARTDSVPGNPDPQYGLFSHAPGEGLATVKINTDFRMPNLPMFAIGDTLYFIGDVGSAGNPQYKLFEHTVGDGPLVAANAISDLVPGGSDEISLLTDVGGVLFFKGTVNGNSKIYKWAPGDPPVLANSNRTNIVPGGDDAPVWNPTELRGGDSSVINGKLFFTAAGGGAYEIDASSPVPIGPGNALANIQGEGDRIVQYQLAYYLVPFDATVVDGIVYEGPGGGGVQYIRQGYPIGGSPTVTYFPVSSTGPTQYLRACSLYGDFRFVANGVQYFWAFNPGTDLCTYMSTTPSHTAFPGFEVPFPALASSQTEFGTAGPAQGWRYDAASGWLLMRGGLSPVHAILTAKPFAYRAGELVLLSPSNVGNDDFPGVPLAGTSSLFVKGDNCGGVVDWQTNLVEVNCERLYRYTP